MTRRSAIEIASLYAAGRSETLNASRIPSDEPGGHRREAELPRPPRIATVKPLMASGVPMSYCV